MNRFVLHIILMLSALSLHGQNLIYNGGFEEYYSCPTGNDLNDGQLEKCKGWGKPTLGTSDYFNSCASQVVGVPTNFWGYKESYDGEGYVGLVPACWFNSGEYCGFEYIQQKLTQPLKSCFEYKFTMFVALADGSTHAIGRLGALLSMDSFEESSDKAIESHPQINNMSIINDLSNWTKIEGTFISSGFEQYITIGYFYSNVKDDTLFIQNTTGLQSFAPYYYIDNVSLIELGEVTSCEQATLNFPNVITANNDGINDAIDISDLLSIILEVRIINRWGNEVARLNKDNWIWNGDDCTEGIYYYLIDFPSETGLKQQNGFIQLVR